MRYLIIIFAPLFCLTASAKGDFLTDKNRVYSLPTFTKNNQGQSVLYWAEKDDKNVSYLYFSVSKDNGNTFSEKKLIYADAGIGVSRLARPKLLFKKDGTMVAVFTYREGGTTPPRPAPNPNANAHEGHGSHERPTETPPNALSGARPKREMQIKYVVSSDNGNHWSTPALVDADTTKLVRGFFDAVVLPNDEIAVAYLKDVKGSTKHEERDLRLALTQNGVFQAEKLIDAVVCDCCNISMLVDAKGKLNIFYRDNNDDIRDIAKMVSLDNGQTFSKSQILYQDKWEIKGCPHSGAMSVATQNNTFITWFSGTKNGQSGIRLVNNEGKLLKVLEANAKNSVLASDANKAVWVWEQTDETGVSSVFFSKLENGKVFDKQSVEGSLGGQNAHATLVNNKILIAFEEVKAGQKTQMKVRLID